MIISDSCGTFISGRTVEAPTWTWGRVAVSGVRVAAGTRRAVGRPCRLVVARSRPVKEAHIVGYIVNASTLISRCHYLYSTILLVKIDFNISFDFFLPIPREAT